MTHLARFEFFNEENYCSLYFYLTLLLKFFMNFWNILKFVVKNCVFFLLDAAKKFNAAEAPVPSEMGAQGTTGAAPGGQPAIPEGNFNPKK